MSTNKGFFGPDWVPLAEPKLVTVEAEKLERYEQALRDIADPEDFYMDTQNARRIAQEALEDA